MSATLSIIVQTAVTKRSDARLLVFKACWERIARYFARRTAVASLRELDDHTLRDIGLARFQIEAAVAGFITLPNRARM
jgi:uncharacterized protein YjiS (DUF1127 family)